MPDRKSFTLLLQDHGLWIHFCFIFLFGHLSFPTNFNYLFTFVRLKLGMMGTKVERNDEDNITTVFWPWD